MPIKSVKKISLIATAAAIGLAVEIIGKIDDTLSSIVEFEPDLVVTQVPCFRYVSLYMFVSGQLDLPRAG